MGRTIQDFKNFEEAVQAERASALARTPQERILLLHRLINSWMRFPKFNAQNNTYSGLKRIKGNA